jgi:hypothetical protein
LVALPAEPFVPLFHKSEDELRTLGAQRLIVDEKPGYPCRVSLADAEVGEIVILTQFTHHDVASPYNASGPIYVRRGAKQATPAAGEVPAMFRHRLLSVRAYDAEAMLVGAQVVPGTGLEEVIERLFADERARYLHVHNAQPGCYNCKVVRVPTGEDRS